MQLTLGSLGVFTSTPAVLFLAPIITPALLELYAATIASLSATTIQARYRPGAWVSHVTLAKDLRQPGPAFEAVAGLELPVTARVETIQMVRFRPVQILATCPLR